MIKGPLYTISAQVKANTICQKCLEKDGRQVPQVRCMMHCVKHLEEHSTDGFTEVISDEQEKDYDEDLETPARKKGKEDKRKHKPAWRMLQCSKILFGSRQKSGLHEFCLKRQFQEHSGEYCRFETDIGSRKVFLITNE